MIIPSFQSQFLVWRLIKYWQIIANFAQIVLINIKHLFVIQILGLKTKEKCFLDIQISCLKTE